MSENKEKAAIVAKERHQELIKELTQIFIDFQVKNKVVIQWIPMPQFVDVQIEDEVKKEK